MYKCKVKKCEYETDKVSLLANHYKWTHKKNDQYVICSYCDEKYQKANLSSHEKRCMYNPENYIECKECNTHIEKHLTFCNSSCSAKYNNRAGKTGYKRMAIDNNGIHPNKIGTLPRYRDICFENYEPKCVICDWDISVEVHHIDSNHENDDVKNLIPLCSNHHIMTRMNEHKDKINKKIYEIVNKKYGAVV